MDILAKRHPSLLKGDYPAGVIWQQAKDYCQWLGKKSGKKIDLPTEAQWEFAARGGIYSKGFIYSGSNNLDEVGCYIDNSYDKTLPVKSKLSNELGLFDMSGNVWEWCQDWYGKYDHNFPVDPIGPNSGLFRVFRGGSWSRPNGDCRNAYRCSGDPKLSRSTHGFRLALKLNK